MALEQIKDIQEKGGSVESLISYCGGLPAPEYSNNPLRYKFSWSPRAVLANTLSPARYMNQGQIVEILGYVIEKLIIPYTNRHFSGLEVIKKNVLFQKVFKLHPDFALDKIRKK